jgi:hypothetical protein
MRPETAQTLAHELAPELLTLAELLDRHDWPWPTWHAALSSASPTAAA